MKALSVFLNGSRDYVQGTQMMARAMEMAVAQAPGPHVLTSATFHRITDRGVLVAKAGIADAAESLGKIQLTTGAGALAFDLVEGPDPAPRQSVAVAPTWHEEPEARQGPLTTRFTVDGLCTGEDYLIAVVQILKQLHERLAPDVTDVWMTGFRSANIPFDPAFPAAKGTLETTCRRSMHGETSWQTLTLTSFTNHTLAVPIRAAITFAFKSGTVTHVN